MEWGPWWNARTTRRGPRTVPMNTILLHTIRCVIAGPPPLADPETAVSYIEVSNEPQALGPEA